MKTKVLNLSKKELIELTNWLIESGLSEARINIENGTLSGVENTSSVKIVGRNEYPTSIGQQNDGGKPSLNRRSKGRPPCYHRTGDETISGMS